MTVRILTGDCRERLKELPDGSVHCVVTSPPYFGLRDYGVDGQMGLEPTPDEFIAGMVDVFREVRRSLRDDGTLWLNIADSYATNGGPGWQGKNGERAGRRFTGTRNSVALREQSRTAFKGNKPKDLIGIPWMLAFALRADGWFLRQDIIWSKPNPMPESVTDRCTKSHEYLFLLTKSPRYHFDADAIAEEIADASRARLAQNVDAQAGSSRVPGKTNGPMKAVVRKSGNAARKPRPDAPDNHGGAQAGSIPWEGSTRNKRDVWTVATVPFDLEHCTACRTTYQAAEHRSLRVEKVRDGDRNVTERRIFCRCGRNDAWLSHFATFPPELIEPCILAGCPVGGTVLDPFFGAGTTGLVADRLHRNAIGCELNRHYVDMARFRLQGDGGLFAQVQAA